MWKKVNPCVCVNINTGVRVEVRQQSDLVYEKEYIHIFKFKFYWDTGLVWKKIDIWDVNLISGKSETTLFSGTQTEAYDYFDSFWKEVE